MDSCYSYDAERDEWLGIVFEGNTVMTIGCEPTEAEIINWLERAMEVQPWIEGNPAVPDMYDRPKH